MVEILPKGSLFNCETVGRCPCGGRIMAGYGGEHKDVPAVIHSLPPCQKFIEIDDPADFLAYVNSSLLASKN